MVAHISIEAAERMEFTYKARRCRGQVVLILFLMMAIMVAMTAAVDALEETEDTKTYIIHVEEPEDGRLGFDDKKTWYASFMPPTAESEGVATSDIIYSYENVISGFAARLTEAQVEAMQNIRGFLHAYPDTILPLQITYSGQFLGLDPQKGLWPQSGFGKGVIVGMLDTGIWPESPSFNDHGIPPVPKRWKGVCQSGTDFNSSNCNNKLIGARVYNSGMKASKGSKPSDYDDSPRDSEGHGTHTSSTAAGSSVLNAELLGNAKGTARGMATAAHVAMYKVCFTVGCFSSDILAGMDDAIADGVDILSLSLGGASLPFYSDSIAIGAFRAIEKGIFVSCAAGNSGPFSSSLSNEAPWITTVGASTLDRNFVANAKLGNGTVFYGESLFPGMGMKQKLLPLVYAGASNGTDANLCIPDSLDPTLVAGKIVLCDRGTNARIEKGDVVRQAGGLAMIEANDEASGEALVADPHVLPATEVGFKEGIDIKAYMKSTENPTATIDFKGTLLGTQNAPAVASFSSRGPSSASPDILKPDILSPGVNVLAAWPLNLSPTGLLTDDRRVKFNIISGTSMATPHVSGLAALLKSAHPEWSPAAIKSALMTTTDTLDHKGGAILDSSTGTPADIFATGAGHANPEKAADPGLIYDLDAEDYFPYLCSLNYTSAQIRVITNKIVTCPASGGSLPGDLNYPSFSVLFNNTSTLSATFKRTVTNVGPATSTYSVEVIPPKGVDVTVNPTKLSFTAVNEKTTYTVTFSAKAASSVPAFAQGSLSWVSGTTYKVRSPMSITWT